MRIESTGSVIGEMVFHFRCFLI